MSTIELRNSILEQLNRIDDVSFLNSIKTIVESKASEKTYQLSENEKKRVEKGRKTIQK